MLAVAQTPDWCTAVVVFACGYLRIRGVGVLLLIGLIGGLLTMFVGCSSGIVWGCGVVGVVVGGSSGGVGFDRIAVGGGVRLCSCSCWMRRGMLLWGWVCKVINKLKLTSSCHVTHE